MSVLYKMTGRDKQPKQDGRSKQQGEERKVEERKRREEHMEADGGWEVIRRPRGYGMRIVLPLHRVGGGLSVL